MFRDDEQKRRALQLLLESVQLARLWTQEGPSDEAIELRRAKAGGFSLSQRLMFCAVWDLWEGSETGDRLSAIVDALDPPRAAVLFNLLIAARTGVTAIDRWVDDEAVRCAEFCGARRVRQSTPAPEARGARPRQSTPSPESRSARARQHTPAP